MTGQQSDFVLYDEQIHTGSIEVLRQFVRVFNQNGAMILGSDELIGEFDRRTFFQAATHISRRDLTSLAAATITHIDSAEWVGVKLSRKFLVQQTVNSWKKLGMDPETLSLVAGRQIGQEQQMELVNTATEALTAAIPQNATYEIDQVATGPLIPEYILQAQGLLGDAGGEIAAILMHGDTYWRYAENLVSRNIFEISGNMILRGGDPGTFGIPILVTDSPSLRNGANDYNTLLLRPNAVRLVNSEADHLLIEEVGGGEQILGRVQGEYDYNVQVGGFTYNTAAGANPNSAALTTPANWSQVVASIKDAAGVRIRHQ